MKCPVCNSDLVQEYHHASNWGTEESCHKCHVCKMYGEVFAYGGTEISIGDFQTGHSQGTDIKKINEGIACLAKVYREEWVST